MDPDIRYHAMQHEELLACYPEQWVEEVLASCRLDGRGMEENDFEERHFTEAERAQAEITESGNPRKPEGEDGKKMLERIPFGRFRETTTFWISAAAAELRCLGWRSM